MGNYENLTVWKKAMKLSVKVYKLTAKFPKSEQYGLVAQMRRAAVSIVSNIAEGYSRQYDREIVQFFYISLGSKAELETQTRIAIELDYISEEKGKELLADEAEVGKILNGLITSLKTSS